MEAVKEKLELVRRQLEKLNQLRGENFQELEKLYSYEIQLSLECCAEVNFREAHRDFLNSSYKKFQKIQETYSKILLNPKVL